MKQYIISNEGQFYKANLHAHSTNSDGHLTPEELKSIYKSVGYSVLAYSDHNVLIDHSDLNDEEFLTLTSVEINVVQAANKSIAYRPCYHINFFPEDPHQVAIPCYNPRDVFGKRTDLRDAQIYIGTPDYVRDYENINDMINTFAKNGFIAMLNHPTWSLQRLEDYKNLDTTHIFSMEIYNHGCYTEGYDEINSHIYDELLRKGHKLYCTATDDNHNHFPSDHARWDSFGGFVMIKAPELTHRAIYNALKAGDFYASTGPKIFELYIEDERLYFKTSPAVKITLTTAVRQAKVLYPEKDQVSLCEGFFDLRDVYPGYIRMTVFDANGKSAWSQPIYGTFSGKT